MGRLGASSRVNMGNAASVSPNESDVVRKGKQPKAQQRRKESNKETTPAPKAPRPRRSDNNTASTPKVADVDAKASETVNIPEAAPTPQITEAVPSKAVDSQDQAPAADSARKGGRPKADGGSDLLDGQDDSELLQRRKSQEKEVGQGRRKASDDRQRERETARGSGEYARSRGGPREEETASEESTSGSSGSESYTSSSYSSGSQESDGDISSEDTFFVPEVSPYNCYLGVRLNVFQYLL